MSFPRSPLPPCISLAVLLLASASAVAADKPEGAAEPGSAPASPLASEPLDRLSATRDRPLFSPTRRPPPPPPPVVQAAEPPPPPPPPPSVALFGVVMDGDEARAIVRTGPAAGVMRVRVGDDIGGWKVAQIEGRRLVLTLDDRIATFTMFAGNGAGGASQSSPAAPLAGQSPPAQASPGQASQGQTFPGQAPPQNQLQPNETAPSGAPAQRKSRRAKT